MLPPTHADQAASTGGGCVVQIQGDNNNVIVSGRPYLDLTGYPVRRAVERGEPNGAGFTPSGEKEADLLRSYTEAIPFIGRKLELERLDAWLDSLAPVSVRVLVGQGGRGKTRLALETCRARTAADWRAGFVTRSEMDRFRKQPNVAEWGWNAPTLVVLDDAAAFTVPLHDWLIELADNKARLNQGGPRLRLLLLERHGTPGAGWWAEAFGRGGDDANAVADMLEGQGPDMVAALRDPVERRSIFAAAYRRAAGREPDLPPILDTRLSKLSWGGEPLFLAMAGLLGARMGIGRALELPPDRLAFEQAQRELGRVREVWLGYGLQRGGANFATHLAALATLRGGLPFVQAHTVIRAERQATGFDQAGDPEHIREALHAALPGPNGGIAPVEPSILGEAMILEQLGSRPLADQTAVVIRAYRGAPDEVAATIVRICQDFAIYGCGMAIGWLQAVCREIRSEPDLVSRLQSLIPHYTVELREIAVDLGQTHLQFLQDEPSRAGALNNQSYRLSELGRKSEALKHIEESVRLYRKLAGSNPNTFIPYLALALTSLSNRFAGLGRKESALKAVEESVQLYTLLGTARPAVFAFYIANTRNTLSHCLSAVGRREDALAAAQYSVRLYCELAKARPDALTPDLAMALSTLSIRLYDLNFLKEALSASEDSVNIYRGLTEARPDAFTPDLANGLSNLSNRLSDLGRKTDALAAIEESVALFSRLAQARPNAFNAGLAMALNNLSVTLLELGQFIKALETAERCEALYKSLSAVYPEAHTQDLAMARLNLSNCLSKQGRRGEALVTMQGSVVLYRMLAKANPDALTPDLAKALKNLGDRHSEAGKADEALLAYHEGMQRLTPAFLATPIAFKASMAELMQSYRKQCKTFGHEPDMLLLGPLLEAFERLRSGGSRA